MMVTRPFQTSGTTYPATQRHIPEGRNPSFLIEFAWIFKNKKISGRRVIVRLCHLQLVAS